MPKILEKISQMDDNALARLLGNAHALLDKSQQNRDAAAVVKAIEDEWARRLLLFQRGDYKPVHPKMVFCQ